MSVYNLGKTIKLLEKAHDQGVLISFENNELAVHVEKGKVIDPDLLSDLKSNKQALFLPSPCYWLTVFLLHLVSAGNLFIGLAVLC